MTTVQLPKMGDVALQASTNAEEAEDALALVKSVSLQTNEDMEQAAAIVGELKTKRKEVDTQLKRFTKPLKGVIKDIEAFFRPAIKALDECEAMLKGKIAAFTEQQASKRDELIDAAGQALRSGEAAPAALLAEADFYMVPKLPGVSIRELWDGEVVDASQIPREFMIPDIKALRALTRARKCDPQIPGWRAFRRSSVAITADDVAR